jgi:hypothetical protein
MARFTFATRSQNELQFSEAENQERAVRGAAAALAAGFDVEKLVGWTGPERKVDDKSRGQGDSVWRAAFHQSPFERHITLWHRQFVGSRQKQSQCAGHPGESCFRQEWTVC